MAWDPDKPADADTAATMMTGVLANWTALQTVLTSTRLTNFTEIPDFFPEGTITFFYRDTAPAGWTIVDDLGDALLAVVGGATYTAGGQSAGTWTQPDHTLVEAEIPAHTHGFSNFSTEIITRGSADTTRYQQSSGGTKATSSTGGGTAHNHGDEWRPAGRVGILCAIDDPAV